MNRVPCKICGAEILSATAVRNQGLCGRCAKGHRPCIYCGNFVSEPLRGGVYAHVECLMKNRQKESGHWHTIEDIDWQMVEGKIHDKLSGLFANPPNPIPKCELVFWIDTNGGLNFDVYQVSPAGHQVRFGKLVKGWIDDMGFFDDLSMQLLKDWRRRGISMQSHRSNRNYETLFAQSAAILRRKILDTKTMSR